MCRDSYSYSFLPYQSCSRVLLVEKDRREFLKKMRVSEENEKSKSRCIAEKCYHEKIEGQMQAILLPPGVITETV
jgi:hypothetical protein